MVLLLHHLEMIGNRTLTRVDPQRDNARAAGSDQGPQRESLMSLSSIASAATRFAAMVSR